MHIHAHRRSNVERLECFFITVRDSMHAMRHHDNTPSIMQAHVLPGGTFSAILRATKLALPDTALRFRGQQLRYQVAAILDMSRDNAVSEHIYVLRTISHLSSARTTLPHATSA